MDAPERTLPPSHIGHSLENDTWFVRFHGFKSIGEAQAFHAAMTAPDARLEAEQRAMEVVVAENMQLREAMAEAQGHLNETWARLKNFGQSRFKKPDDFQHFCQHFLVKEALDVLANALTTRAEAAPQQVIIPADKLDEVARRVADHMLAQGYPQTREELQRAVRQMLAPQGETADA